MQLEMQVVIASVPRPADVPDDLPASDEAARTLERVEVGVVEAIAVRSDEPDGVATETTGRELDGSISDGNDRSPTERNHVDPLLPSTT
jgi:hypothetical protein